MAIRSLDVVPSVCPHDCTSTCALEVERLDAHTIGRVRGSHRNTYTRGVICERWAATRSAPITRTGSCIP